jgi:pyrroloquinoline quinone (PQQ) biosynthesis protein C
MSRLSHSKQLRAKIRLAEPCLSAVADNFWRHPRLAKMFPDFLFMLHSIIRSSVPMMMAAGESARSRADSDPVAARIAGYYSQHAREEAHHDEWLLDDMVAIGMDRSEVLTRMPSPTVASVVGAQYYWIFHVHPVALLGYLAVLEGNPPSAKELKNITTQHGLPEEGFRTMFKHAQLDPHHRNELYEQIDELPLNDDQASLLTLSAFHTIDQLSQAFQEILDSHRN